MPTFDHPFDPSHRLNSSGCACGRHRSQAEHDHEARRVLQCAPVEAPPASAEKRYEGVVASAVMRAVFPKDVT
jgi:nitrate/nitrite transport system substrate-binding protein